MRATGWGLVALAVAAVGACAADPVDDASPAAPAAEATTSEPMATRRTSTTTTATSTPPPTTTTTDPLFGVAAEVGSITDGDTFRTTAGERIRLIGVDTPEVDQDACFAAEATAALGALIPPGEAVRLVLDVEPTDRFGRTLAYVHRAADDLFVNRELAVQGFALQLTVPPNVARADELGAAVAEARDAGRGLWSACIAPPPPPPPPVPPPPPAPLPAVGQAPSGGCDPSYPDVCIPPAPPDLDCGEIAHRRFTVVAPDPHGFDGDVDGVGCESG